MAKQSSVTKRLAPGRWALSSFDPRYRNVWLQAALSPVIFKMTSEKDAVTFQQRLHFYRKAVRLEEGEAAAAPLYRARLSRNGTIITLSAGDLRFDNLLSQFSSPPQIIYDTPEVRAPDSDTPLPETDTEMSDLDEDSAVPLDELLKNF